MSVPHAVPSSAAGQSQDVHRCDRGGIAGNADDQPRVLGGGLPQAKALNHSDPLLSPRQASRFNVDGFLVSRAPGATLQQITDELQCFRATLKEELDEVVDRDFRGFVNLGVALKAEGPRIARLDWKVASEEDGGAGTDEEHNAGRHGKANDRRTAYVDLPRDASGNLGLERVRVEMEGVRDLMRSAEHAARSTLSQRETIEAERSNLQVLLSFSDSLARLESLLMPTEMSGDMADVDDADEAASLGHTSSYWRAFDQTHLNADLAEADSDYLSSSPSPDDELSDGEHCRTSAKQTTSAAISTDRIKARRRSSGIDAARRRSSGGMGSDSSTSVLISFAKPTMSLPSRVARAASEHATLIFLASQAQDMGYSDYVGAHAERMASAQKVLKADLETLVRTLTALHGPSLLVTSGKNVESQEGTYAQAHKSELESWSQSGQTSKEERRAEQSAWLETALATWIALPQNNSDLRPPDDTLEAEECIKQHLVEPWCTKNIRSVVLHEASTASQQHKALPAQHPVHASHQADLLLYDERDVDGWPLTELYNNILNFVAGSTSSVSFVAEKVVLKRGTRTATAVKAHTQAVGLESDNSQIRCEVFVRSIWRAIATQVMEQLGGQLFFVGRPQEFRRNYVITKGFLRAIEALAPSPRAVDALQRDPVYLAFRKRWQLPVYFQMRLREVVSGLEASLAASSGPNLGNSAHAGPLPLMPATQASVQAFAAPWSDSSHIHDLSHRQWRLSLQIVSRYRNWLQDELPADVLPAHRRVIDAGRTTTPTRSSFEQQHRNATPYSAVASPTRAGTPALHDVDADEQLVSLCTAFAADALWFEAKVRSIFDEKIVPRLYEEVGVKVSGDVAADMRDVLHASLSLHIHLVPLLSARVTSILRARCVEPLRLVRSVSTQYRSATAAASAHSRDGSGISAVEPSFFVNQFLRPVRQYLGKADLTGKSTGRPQEMQSTTAAPVLSGLLPQDVRQRWIKEVVEDFVVRYTASLQTMSRNFESLQRLKRVNAGPASGTATPTGEEADADRMYAQMAVDVEYLQRDVDALQTVHTVVPTDTPAWNRLRAAARGELDD